jgi:hypothetical protein
MAQKVINNNVIIKNVPLFWAKLDPKNPQMKYVDKATRMSGKFVVPGYEWTVVSIIPRERQDEFEDLGFRLTKVTEKFLSDLNEKGGVDISEYLENINHYRKIKFKTDTVYGKWKQDGSSTPRDPVKVFHKVNATTLVEVDPTTVGNNSVGDILINFYSRDINAPFDKQSKNMVKIRLTKYNKYEHTAEGPTGDDFDEEIQNDLDDGFEDDIPFETEEKKMTPPKSSINGHSDDAF